MEHDAVVEFGHRKRVIRKTTKTRGSFPTDAAATKLIYLAPSAISKRRVRQRTPETSSYPERFNK